MAEFDSPKRTHRALRELCNDIRVVTTRYDIAVSRIPYWCAEADGADELLRLLDVFARQAFPALLLKVVGSLRPDHPMDKSVLVLYRALIQSSWVLQLHHRDWPPQLTRCHTLAQGITRICTLLTTIAAVEGLMAFETVLEFSASVVYRMLLDDSVDGGGPLSHPMLATICTSVNVVSGFMLNTRIFRDSSIPRCLMTFVVAWHDLMSNVPSEILHDPRPALQAGTLAVVAMTRCNVPETCETLKFFCILAQLHRHETQPTADVALFVHCLLACSEKYPAVSDACSFVVMQQLKQCSDLKYASVSSWGCAVTACMKRTLSYMQGGLPLVQLNLERKMLSYATQAAVVAWRSRSLHGPGARTEEEEEEEDVDLDGLETLLVGLSLPGSVSGIEALLRSARVGDDPGHLAVVAALSSMKLILARPHPHSNPWAQIQSLTVTMRKLMLCMMVHNGAHVDWASRRTEWLARTMIRLLGALVVHVPANPHSHRMYIIMAVTLQPLLKNVLRFNVPAGQRILWDLQLVSGHFPMPPDLVKTPQLWSSCVEAYMLLHGRRLLHGCGSLQCVNLTGTLDSLLPTLLCMGCRRSRYCSKECQRLDWVEGGHGRVCGTGAWAV